MKYEFDKRTGTIEECELEQLVEQIIIPSEIEGVKVKVIGANAFGDCPNVKSIIVPEGVTTIESGAFDIRGLEFVNMPRSLEYLDEAAVGLWNYGASIKFKGGLSSENYEFDSSTGTLTLCDVKYISEMIIPSEINGVKVTCVAGLAEDPEDYYTRYHVTKLVIPETVMHIGDYAFLQMGIEEVIIPDSVVEIGRMSFAGCKKLATISFGQGVQEIGEAAFDECKNLRDIKWGSNIKTIDYCAFCCCDNLIKIAIPNGVVSIVRDAFSLCKNVEEITIGEKVETFGNMASATGIKQIVIPDSVKKIEDSAFQDCKELSEVIIGRGVEFIGQRTFVGCSNLKTIVLPEGVRGIHEYAFEHLEDFVITIPRSMEYMGYYTFSECKNWVINYRGTEEEWKKIDTTYQRYTEGYCGLKKFNFNYSDVKELNNKSKTESSSVAIDFVLDDFLASLEPEKISEEEERLYSIGLTKEQVQETYEKALSTYKERYPELEEEEVEKKIYVDIYNFATRKK